MATGFGNVRFCSWNRLSARPLLIAWFCSGHSPPLSQTGQSSGWLMSSSSMTPCCALSATTDVSWVLMTMPGMTVVVQDAAGLGMPRPLPMSVTSTRHWRQAPAGSSSGGSQKRGMEMPSCSAARMSNVPLGTEISIPSMVTVTRSSLAGACVMSVGSSQDLVRVGRAATVQVSHVLVAEVLDRGRHRAGGAVAEGAERPAEDVVGQVEQRLEILFRALAGLEPVVDADVPVRALAARGALAARLVAVELRPLAHGA